MAQIAAKPDTENTGVKPEPSDKEVHSFDELFAEATARYARKEYEEGAELYSRAAELQAKKNGEMSPLNAELLFCYGRCLYQAATLNSDILGSKITKEVQPKDERLQKAGSGLEEGPTKAVAQIDGLNDSPDLSGQTAIANFQFHGDEDYEHSDDNSVDGGSVVTNDDEEDDFSNSYEILDLARILFLKRLEHCAHYTNSEEALTHEEDSSTRTLKERLAETYDIQAEILLEGEQFSDAVDAFTSALGLKDKLYPRHSNLIAEAHYKLSLAYEFASSSTVEGATGNTQQTNVSHATNEMLASAVVHMKAAIASCQSRIAQEEDRLSHSLSTSSKLVESRRSIERDIEDVKDMVREMRIRLDELTEPAQPLDNPIMDGATESAAKLGTLSKIMNRNPQGRAALLQHVTEGAKDLTGLIKRKKVATPPEVAADTPATSKRKASPSTSPYRNGMSKKSKSRANLKSDRRES